MLHLSTCFIESILSWSFIGRIQVLFVVVVKVVVVKFVNLGVEVVLFSLRFS